MKSTKSVHLKKITLLSFLFLSKNLVNNINIYGKMLFYRGDKNQQYSVYFIAMWPEIG